MGALSSKDVGLIVDAGRLAAREELSRARVLIVDDSAVTRSILEGHLRNAGYVQIASAADGVEAVAAVNTFSPDIVITDLMMPNLDGYELCRQLRASENTADLPILVQTGATDSQERARAFASGASDLITKPISHSELLARVQIHLDRRRLMADLTEYRRRMAQELDIARSMQAALLPSPDRLSQLRAHYALDLAATYRASDELAGDIWGVREVAPERLHVFVGDFTGHGVGAALNVFRLHSFLNGSQDQPTDPAEWLTWINAFLCRSLQPGQFLTMASIHIDLAAGALHYAAAGAPPPIVLSGTDHVARLLDGGGLPLGIDATAEYQTHRVSFERESTLVVYSDSLVETPEPPGNRFDMERLRRFVEVHDVGSGAQELHDKIHQEILAVANGKLADDLTLLVLHRRGPHP